MSEQNTPTIDPEYVFPHVRVGDFVRPGWEGKVRRTEHTPGGSQTIWTGACPSWCTGHNPDELALTGPEDYDWDDHGGPEGALRWAALSDHTGRQYRAAGWLHLETRVLGGQVPMIEVGGASAGALSVLTTGEARSLARLLEHLADTLEGATR